MTTLPRILLVEDDPGDARLALAVFHELLLADQVLAVTDGVEAWDFLRSRGRFRDRAPGNPALMLLDLKLPRIDGLELLQRVKSDPDLRLIPIVILSSSREHRDLRRAYELGANGYVVKTIDYEEYDAVLKAAVQYWAVANEAPPGSLPQVKPRLPETKTSQSQEN